MPLTRAIGLMSGTSMDGIDAAVIETDGEAQVRLGPTAFTPYADADRSLLRHALADAVGLGDRRARPGVLPAAEELVTRRHAEAVEAFLRRHNLAAGSIDLVGFHGQTVLHDPARHLTVQIGDGEALAARLGLRVVFDFRAADVAAGGQGAPLVPVFHRALVEAAGLEPRVAVVNIGGVANMTFVSGGDADPVACDTGPGNALIDDLMLERTGVAMDRDGAAGLRGRVAPAILQELLQHPYFARPAPKSLDRNAFSRAAVAGLATDDAAATLAAFTARAILDALEPFRPISRLVVCGGGTRNGAIMSQLAAGAGCPVETADALGWSADFMEAQAFAYLAVRRTRGLPMSFPTTTGVPRRL